MNKIKDLRQTDNWAKYLSSLGWSAVRTSSGILVNYRNTFLGNIVKIQRPSHIESTDIMEIEKKFKRILFIKIEPLNQCDLYNLGFKKSKSPLIPPSTVYINLEEKEDTIRKNFSRSAKYAINKAVRDGNKVEIYRNPANEELARFHEILKITGKRNEFYVQPFSDLVTKRDIFQNESFLIMVNDKKGNLLCGNLYLGNEGATWALHTATGKSGTANKGGYLLVWNAILYFKKLGYKTMDMEGIKDNRFPAFTKNWGGFTEFKRRFNGQVIEMPDPIIKICNPIFKILNLIPSVGL